MHSNGYATKATRALHAGCDAPSETSLVSVVVGVGFGSLSHLVRVSPPGPLSLCVRSKGISRSALPYRRTPPSWCRAESDNIKGEIVKFAKKGLTPSQIGVRLRDSMGVPQVATVTGVKILRILKTAGMSSVFRA